MLRTVIAKYTLIEVFKRRLIYLYLLSVFICISMASYGASLAMADKQATLVAFYGFLIRLITVAMVGIYIILIEMRILERDNVFIWLGLPISRLRYLSEKIMAYTAIMLLLTVITLLPLLWMGVDISVSLAWSTSFYCELTIAAFLALLLAILFRQPLTAISAYVAIYLFARSSAEFFRHSSNILAESVISFEYLIAAVVKGITYLVPKLEQFAPASWLLYPETAQPEWLAVLLQTIIFCGLLMVLALERLQRRKF